MTARERFQRLMRYEPVERLPVLALEPFEAEALTRWRAEGLPEDADVVEFLGMSRLVHVPVSFGPSPPFEQEVICEDEDSIVVRSSMGALVRRDKAHPTMFYGHVEHPVKTAADWEEYKTRFRHDSSGRLPDDWSQRVVKQLQGSEHPVGLCLFPFFFRLGFYAMGMQRFLTGFYDLPELMHDMFGFWGEFVLETIRPVVDSLRLDYVLFGEDLAGKNGPLISPRIYEQFWYPYQDPIVQLLRAKGVPVICQWSAGRFQELLPGLLEHGFNCTWPLEVTAGMDARELRRRYGRRLLLGGNIAKEAVIAGPEAIDVELERLLPLIREGGFIPALDDMAAPDMPFSHYRYLIDRLQASDPSTTARATTLR